MTEQHIVAVLIANGFEEAGLATIQKTLREHGVSIKMVSCENGVVNGWAGTSWGCFFPVDQSISTALASDYSGLIIMGGDRSMSRLEKTAHTDRFVKSFDRVEKPVLAVGSASRIVENSITTEAVEDNDARGLLQFIHEVLAIDLEMDLAA